MKTDPESKKFGIDAAVKGATTGPPAATISGRDHSGQRTPRSRSRKLSELSPIPTQGVVRGLQRHRSPNAKTSA
jgi:hypothetical protein